MILEVRSTGLIAKKKTSITCKHKGVRLRLDLLIRQATPILILKEHNLKCTFCLSPKPQCLCFISAPTLDSSMMSTKSFLLWGCVPVTPWWLIRARRLRTTSLVNLKTPCSWMFLLVFPSSSVHMCFCEIVSSVVHVVTQRLAVTRARWPRPS